MLLLLILIYLYLCGYGHMCVDMLAIVCVEIRGQPGEFTLFFYHGESRD